MTIEVFPLWMLYKDFEVPVGSIIMWPAPSAPTGWMVCDGSSISRSTYKELWNSIRETYGSGDGFTTFNIPNLSNTFIKGTSPDYVSGNYTWSGRSLPGTTESEQFNHQMLGVTIGGSVGISTYVASVQYQVLTSNDESHSHSDAVQDGYRYTTIDDTDEGTASHDNSQDYETQRHLPGKGSRHGESVSGVQSPYGTYYDNSGVPQRTVESFQYNTNWNHSHSASSHTSANASQGIIGGVDGTTLVNKSGGGQIAAGTGSIGNHTHDVTYSVSRDHSHTITGQTGSITTSGLDAKIEPRYMPLLYIIYTGVS